MMKNLGEDLGIEVTRYSKSDLAISPLSKGKFDLVVVSHPFDVEDLSKPFKLNSTNKAYIHEFLYVVKTCKELVSETGAIAVYGPPCWLSHVAVELEKTMTFKYWISVKGPVSTNTGRFLPIRHLGLLLFIKHKVKTKLHKVRYPHIYCRQCSDFLADWGGKKHLRHKFGPVISDVWDDRDDFIDADYKLGVPTVERLVEIICKEGNSVLLYDGGENNLKPFSVTNLGRDVGGQLSDEASAYSSNGSHPDHFVYPKDVLRNTLHLGNCIEIMTKWVKERTGQFDLIFADPPYNLEKNYGKIDDKLQAQEYIAWCNEWLGLCAELLRPHGTMYVLNLPKWCYHHAVFLSDKLFLQRWIVWDALSDPRGNIMPAHYGLLVFTKDENHFTYHQPSPVPVMDLCLRPSCIKDRVLGGPREEVSDIWYDVHRIKHKRDRDAHPCQLPPKLLERTISMSSNPGELVFDPFLGTGTTVSVAKRLGRAYAGIDIDESYIRISEDRIRLSPQSRLNL